MFADLICFFFHRQHHFYYQTIKLCMKCDSKGGGPGVHSFLGSAHV